MHVRVYYKYCDVSTRNLATFTRTTTGPEVTSLVEAKGLCVRNAVTVGSVCFLSEFTILMISGCKVEEVVVRKKLAMT